MTNKELYLKEINPQPCACAGPNPPYFWVGNTHLFVNKLSGGLKDAVLAPSIYYSLDGYERQYDTHKVYKNKQEAMAALHRALQKLDETVMERCLRFSREAID